MPSPYDGIAEEHWLEKTKELVAAHPLSQAEILRAAEIAWSHLWNSTVGDSKTGFAFRELAPPATIVGYLFEKLLARELASKHPKVWIGGKGSEKDLHCLSDEGKSIEIKTSGQLGYKIFGNRSYGQQVESDAGKKDKSGYYITVNFFGEQLTLLRFGWIDGTDWQSQKAQTGQMAGLTERVYQRKLIAIRGAYELRAPVVLLDGVGGKAQAELKAAGISTIEDLVRADGDKIPPRYKKLQHDAREKYHGLF